MFYLYLSSIYLSIIYLSVYLSIYLSIYLSSIYLSSIIYLPIYLSIYLSIIYHLFTYHLSLSPYCLLKHNIHMERHSYHNCTAVEFSPKEHSYVTNTTQKQRLLSLPFCLLPVNPPLPTPTKGNHYPECSSVAWFANFRTSCKCSHTICPLWVVFILNLLFEKDVFKEKCDVLFILVLLILFPSPKTTTHHQCYTYSVHALYVYIRVEQLLWMCFVFI